MQMLLFLMLLVLLTGAVAQYLTCHTLAGKILWVDFQTLLISNHVMRHNFTLPE